MSVLNPADTRELPLGRGALLWFFALTFLIAWLVLGFYVLAPATAEAVAGPISGNHPLFFLAVYAPALAAVTIVLLSSGPAGLRSFLSRLFIWRVGPLWYVWLLIGVPAIFLLGAALRDSLTFDHLSGVSGGMLVTFLLLMIIKGPVEEIGWRGFALPLLQRRFAPVWAGLILGLIWGAWHIPAFLLAGTQQSAWAFTPFFAGTIAISVIMTALFNASRGSILLAAVFHYQLINPLWPEAQPWDSLLLAAVAGLLVWFQRDRMFSRTGAVTEIFPEPSAH